MAKLAKHLLKSQNESYDLDEMLKTDTDKEEDNYVNEG